MHIVSLLLFSLAFSSQKKERMSIEPNGINNDMSNTKKMKQVSTKPDSIVFPPDPNETAEQVVDRVFLSFGLTEKFPKACHEHVEKFLKNEPTADTNLKDLTDIPFVTIDNDNSMDLDQAMWICRADPPVKGVVPHRHENAAGYLVSYALADGAYFVPVMSPLFQHALTRGGTSYYLPGKCIPMLPRALSEDVMSLNPHVKRRALVFDMYLSEEGSVLKTFYTWAVIRSLWKGTYREVAAYYDARDAGKPSLLAEQVYTETLDLLREVGLLRRKLAFMRDVVDYKREGSAIGIRDGKLVFVKKERYSSEQYNEQISLLCNTEGARLLAFLDELEEASGKDVLYPIYRTQDAPRKDQVFTLRAVISNSLKAHNLNMTEWTWQKDGESIAAYVRKLRVHLESLPPSSTDYRRWTNVVNVIERQAMITNVAASFTSDPAQGHHSLKMSHYARFSSPMRELVGCYTHWGLWETRNDGGGNSELSQSESIALRTRVIRAARRAKETQRKIDSCVHLHMLNLIFYKELHNKKRRRQVFTGVLMGMDFSDKRKSRRCYVKLDDPSIEIKVYGEDLDYHYNCRYAPLGSTFNHRGSTIDISPLPGSFAEDVDDENVPPTFLAGDRVCIQVADYAQFYGRTSRSRWIFVMFHDKDEDIQDDIVHLPIIRNSVVDRDMALISQESEE